jgi:hypothetical protein
MQASRDAYVPIGLSKKPAVLRYKPAIEPGLWWRG